MNADIETLPGFGPFRLNLEIPVLYRDGNEVPLRRLACRVLKCLYENPSGLNFEQLRLCAWGPNSFIDDKTIRNTVGEVRAALGPEYDFWIRSRPGRGYVLAIPRPPRNISPSKLAPDQIDSSGGARLRDKDLPPLQPLVGRLKELSALDKTYRDRRVRVAIISGPVGGEGKSQLAHSWLKTKSATGRRDLLVFAFSFNSQGASEARQTSSDPFFNAALSWFRVQIDSKALPDEKARLLAQAIVERRAILYLDGVEPLQDASAGSVAPLKDLAMHTLLLHLARPGNHFCLISTRYVVSDLQDNPCTTQIQLRGLDPADAVKLLRSHGVRGEHKDKDAPLRNLAKRWDSHPLSLVLLARYLAKYFEGDVRGADTIKHLGGRGDSLPVPYRPALMLEAHERRLAESNKAALQLLRLLGLFDRPADERWVKELTSPPIRNISEKLEPAWLNPIQRNATLRHLVDLGLISTKYRSSFRRIYCHALIRQYLGYSMRVKLPTPWRQANARLFHYFAKLVLDPLPQTRGEVQTLYQAVAHGCAAGHFKRVFDEVYWPRISRESVWFATDRLGLVAEDLACLASFFENPFSELVKSLNANGLGAQVLSLAGFRLRTLGRLEQAEHVLQQALIRFERLRLWEAASGEANNLAVLYRMQGRLEEALAEGQKALRYAGMTKKKNLQLIVARLSALGEFYHYRGNFQEALRLFRQAEAQYIELQPNTKYLPSTIGFRYCEMLLNRKTTSKLELLERARSIPTNDTTRYWLLDRALSFLCEARALMAKDHGRRVESRAEHLLRQAYELTKKSHHRDNQVRVAIALSECLRLKGRSALREATSLVQEAMGIADSNKMYLHRLDCDFEALQIQLATEATPRVWTRLRSLSERARTIHYELLCVRIGDLRKHHNMALF